MMRGFFSASNLPGRPQPFARFVARLFRHASAAGVVMVVSLVFGVLGYRLTERMPWIDAILNAAMILGGMGPVDPMKTAAGKLFASFYALYSGMIFVVAASILVSPIAHRIFHLLHLEHEEREAQK